MSSWHADGGGSQEPTLPEAPGVGQGALRVVETQSQDRTKVYTHQGKVGICLKVPEGGISKGFGEILSLIILWAQDLSVIPVIK